MTLDYVLVKFQVGGKGVPLINRRHFLFELCISEVAEF